MSPEKPRLDINRLTLADKCLYYVRYLCFIIHVLCGIFLAQERPLYPNWLFINNMTLFILSITPPVVSIFTANAVNRVIR